MIVNFLKNITSYKFTKDSLATLISQIFLGISGLLINVIVSNFYGPSGLGIVNQSFAYFFILSVIINLGIPNSLAKHSAEYFNDNVKLQEILSTSFFLNLLISIIIIIVLYIFLFFWGEVFFDTYLLYSIKISILAIPFYVLNKNYLGFLNGTRRMYEYSFYQSLRYIFLLLFIILFSFLNYKYYELMFSLIITESLMLVILTLRLRRFVKLFLKSEYYKKHLDFGSKTIITMVIDEINKNVSIILIGFFWGNFYAGIYSFASTIALGVFTITSVIQANFNPIISYLSSQKMYRELQDYINKIKSIAIKIMIAVNIAMIIAYPFLIIFLLNDKEYFQSILPFYIMMIGIFPSSFYLWCGSVLTMSGFLKDNILRVLYGLIFSIILNLILIPLLKVEGASIAMALNYLFSLFLLNYFTKKTMGLKLI